MNRSAGFAYLFLLFTIALLAISLLAAGTLQRYARIRSDEAELLRVGSEFRRALQSYRHHTAQRTFPASLDELLDDKRSRPTKRHLRKIYFDPITRTRDWGFVKEEGRIVGIHSLSDRQPMKVAGFVPENHMFEGSGHYSDWVFLAAPMPVEALGTDSSRL